MKTIREIIKPAHDDYKISEKLKRIFLFMLMNILCYSTVGLLAYVGYQVVKAGLSWHAMAIEFGAALLWILTNQRGNLPSEQEPDREEAK